MAEAGTARVRRVAVPVDLGDAAPDHGTVRLPLRLSWSGETMSYDLSNRRHLRRVYEQVLREGTEADVRAYVRATTLLEVWDELWLPPAVRQAWEPWITARRTAP